MIGSQKTKQSSTFTNYYLHTNYYSSNENKLNPEKTRSNGENQQDGEQGDPPRIQEMEPDHASNSRIPTRFRRRRRRRCFRCWLWEVRCRRWRRGIRNGRWRRRMTWRPWRTAATASSPATTGLVGCKLRKHVDAELEAHGAVALSATDEVARPWLSQV